MLYFPTDGPERNALLNSIQGFSKGGLKKSMRRVYRV